MNDKLKYNKGDYVSLRQSLDIDWELLFEPYINDVESMWNVFKNLVICKSRIFVPPVKVF